MQNTIRRVISFIGVGGFIILLATGIIKHYIRHYFHEVKIVDSVQVPIGNSATTIYLTDTLRFAGEKIPVNDSLVRFHLTYLLSTNKMWFTEAYDILTKSPEILPTIKKNLMEQNVPPDFCYLAFDESHFKNLGSVDGMGGIWQLQAGTARRFGLRVDSLVDQRFDIGKSTIAAANCIKYLHSIYKNWIYTAAAYNTSPAAFDYNLQALKIKNKKDFFRNYYLSGYVMRIIAFKIIFEAADREVEKAKYSTVK